MKLHSFAFVLDADDLPAGVNFSAIGPDGYTISQDVYPTVDAAYQQAKAILRDAGFMELTSVETPVETPEETPKFEAQGPFPGYPVTNPFAQPTE